MLLPRFVFSSFRGPRKTRRGRTMIPKLLLSGAALVVLFGLITSAAMGAPSSQDEDEPQVIGAWAWGSKLVDDKDDEFSNMSDRSLQLDSDGRPNIAFGGTNLYFASFDGSDWNLQIVDSSPNVGKYAALALDSDDEPRISYYDEANGNLKYARWDGEWKIEVVDSSGDVGRFTSIVLPSDTRPQISYYDATNGDLKYIR